MSFALAERAIKKNLRIKRACQSKDSFYLKFDHRKRQSESIITFGSPRDATVPIFMNERLSYRFAPIANNYDHERISRLRSRIRVKLYGKLSVDRAVTREFNLSRGNQSRYRDISIIELTAVYTRR